MGWGSGPQLPQVFPVHRAPLSCLRSAGEGFLVTTVSLQPPGAPSSCCCSTRGPWT